MLVIAKAGTNKLTCPTVLAMMNQAKMVAITEPEGTGRGKQGNKKDEKREEKDERRGRMKLEVEPAINWQQSGRVGKDGGVGR